MPSNEPALVIPIEPSLIGSASLEPLPFGDVERSQFVRDLCDGSQATLACAAASIARVEQEVDGLWRDALMTERRELSERLVDVSHVLRRASRLLEGQPEIG